MAVYFSTTIEHKPHKQWQYLEDLRFNKELYKVIYRNAYIKYFLLGITCRGLEIEPSFTVSKIINSPTSKYMVKIYNDAEKEQNWIPTITHPNYNSDFHPEYWDFIPRVIYLKDLLTYDYSLKAIGSDEYDNENKEWIDKKDTLRNWFGNDYFEILNKLNTEIKGDVRILINHD